MKGWMSNIPLRKTDDTSCTDEINLLKTLSDENVLGVAWNQEEDSFTYKVNLDGRRDNETLTKRKVLAT